MQFTRKASSTGATVKRLLVAAAHEFALHGFEAARVRDIVDAAGANLAAVNYHFGGKTGLYEATLATLLRRAHDDLPVDSLQTRILPPEERLLAFARVMLFRYLGGDHPSVTSRIIAHELLDPTPAIELILRDATGPQWKRLRAIVAELLGPRATEEDVAFASLSIAGQWHFYLFGRGMLAHQYPELSRKPDLVDRLAEHIAAFSIAAIRARRLQFEAESPGTTCADPPTGQARKPKLQKSGTRSVRMVKAARREKLG